MKRANYHIAEILGGTLVLLLMLLASTLLAQSPAQVNASKGIAIKGYDPVAYFTQGRAVRGDREITTTYQGVIYRFSTSDSKALFLKTPDKYLPAYGGWCAYAMGANGDKVNIDPETYKIRNGRLLLFYNSLGTNTLTLWNENEAELEEEADANWKEIITEQN